MTLRYCAVSVECAKYAHDDGHKVNAPELRSLLICSCLVRKPRVYRLQLDCLDGVLYILESKYIVARVKCTLSYHAKAKAFIDV